MRRKQLAANFRSRPVPAHAGVPVLVPPVHVGAGSGLVPALSGTGLASSRFRGVRVLLSAGSTSVLVHNLSSLSSESLLAIS